MAFLAIVRCSRVGAALGAGGVRTRTAEVYLWRTEVEREAGKIECGRTCCLAEVTPDKLPSPPAAIGGGPLSALKPTPSTTGARRAWLASERASKSTCFFSHEICTEYSVREYGACLPYFPRPRWGQIRSCLKRPSLGVMKAGAL